MVSRAPTAPLARLGRASSGPGRVCLPNGMHHTEMAMGQNPNRTPNIPIPTKIGSKMGGEITHHPKRDPKTVVTTTESIASPATRLATALSMAAGGAAKSHSQLLRKDRSDTSLQPEKAPCGGCFFFSSSGGGVFSIRMYGGCLFFVSSGGDVAFLLLFFLGGRVLFKEDVGQVDVGEGGLVGMWGCL